MSPIIALISIISVALLAILVLLFSYFREQTASGEKIQFTAFILSLWIVAVTIWGSPFFKIPLVFDITVERIFFLIIILLVLIGILTGKVDLRTNKTLELCMFLFCIICISSMLQHGFARSRPWFPAPWNSFINGYLFPFIVFLFAKNFLTNERSIQLVLHTLFFLGVYLSVMAFFEFFNLRDFIYPRYFASPKILFHIDRARGPFINAAYNGVALTIGFTAGVHILSQKKGFAKILYVMLLALFFPAVFFTQTRSVYLGFFIVLFLLFAFYRTSYSKLKLFSLPVALFIILLLFNLPRLSSPERRAGGVLQVAEVKQRIGLMKRSALMSAANPFFGIGFAQFVPESLKRFPGRVPLFGGRQDLTQHNHILGLFAETGFLGLFTYFIIIALITRRLYQLKGRIPEFGTLGANLLLIIFIVWLVYLNSNLFVEPSFSLYINAIPFMFAGLADGLYNTFILYSKPIITI